MIWHYSAFRRGGVRNTSRWGLVSQLGGVSKLKEEGLDLMEIKGQRRRVMKAT